MRTWYVGHDQAYKKRKSAGQPGWNTKEGYAELQAHFSRLLETAACPPRATLLECGCGAGNMSLWYARQGFRVSGVDIAPTAIAWAQDRARHVGLSVDFRVGDVCTLEGYGDASFDIVVDGSCLHCIIGDDRSRFLASVMRILKLGGTFLSYTMCGEVKGELLSHFDEASRCLVYGDIISRYIGLPRSILSEMQQSGLEIVHTEHEMNQETCDCLSVIATRPDSHEEQTGISSF
jgi:ubiquinone/menaquinone biosynthesis C-methylase UbiE